jgi:hypothetical protein
VRLRTREDAIKILSSSVLADGIVYPEEPRWHDVLPWFADVHAQRVLTVGSRRRPGGRTAPDDVQE